MPIVKVELIILSIIAVISFITGVVINIIDALREKKLDDNRVKAKIINAPLEGTTIIKVDNKEEKKDEKPVIIESIDMDDDII